MDDLLRWLAPTLVPRAAAVAAVHQAPLCSAAPGKVVTLVASLEPRSPHSDSRRPDNPALLTEALRCQALFLAEVALLIAAEVTSEQTGFQCITSPRIRFASERSSSSLGLSTTNLSRGNLISSPLSYLRLIAPISSRHGGSTKRLTLASPFRT